MFFFLQFSIGLSLQGGSLGWATWIYSISYETDKYGCKYGCILHLMKNQLSYPLHTCEVLQLFYCSCSCF